MQAASHALHTCHESASRAPRLSCPARSLRHGHLAHIYVGKHNAQRKQRGWAHASMPGRCVGPAIPRSSTAPPPVIDGAAASDTPSTPGHAWQRMRARARSRGAPRWPPSCPAHSSLYTQACFTDTYAAKPPRSLTAASHGSESSHTTASSASAHSCAWAALVPMPASVPDLLQLCCHDPTSWAGCSRSKPARPAPPALLSPCRPPALLGRTSKLVVAGPPHWRTIANAQCAKR